MDLLLSTKKKEFYIDLTESRYYYPGDIIKGNVVLDLDKPIKTNHIRLTLIGEVQADNSTLQVITKTWYLATSPLNDGKAHVLEAQIHRFPFEFQIPHDEAKLPSSLKLSSLAGVQYVMTALHDRPFVPERLSSQTKKEIRFLEHIDISQPEYLARGHVYDNVRVLGHADDNKKVKLSLTLPRYAVVRGDILPLEINIKHYQALARKDGVKVYLIRRVYNGKNRRSLSERKSIKSNALHIDVSGDSAYEQTINTKLLIPTNTPPTVSVESGRILAVDYSIRVVVNLNDPSPAESRHENYIKLESSIIIGTYPKASLSIDDDDDDLELEGEETGVEEEEVEALLDEIEEMASSISDDHGSVLSNTTTSVTSPATTATTTKTMNASVTDEFQQLSVKSDQRHQPSDSGSGQRILLTEKPLPSLEECLPQHQPSSSSLTIIDPTTAQPSHQQQLEQRQSSVSVNEQHTAISQQSSSISVMSNMLAATPTEVASNGGGGSTIIDPTVRQNELYAHHPHRHAPLSSSPSSSSLLQHIETNSSTISVTSSSSSCLSSGGATLIDPTVKRNDQPASDRPPVPPRKPSAVSSSSSSSLLQPSSPTTSSAPSSTFNTTTTPGSGYAMASMPDISSYVTPKTSSPPQLPKRPPVHLYQQHHQHQFSNHHHQHLASPSLSASSSTTSTTASSTSPPQPYTPSQPMASFPIPTASSSTSTHMPSYSSSPSNYPQPTPSISSAPYSNNNNNNTNNLHHQHYQYQSYTSHHQQHQPHYNHHNHQHSNEHPPSTVPLGFAMPMPMTMPDHTQHQPYHQPAYPPTPAPAPAPTNSSSYYPHPPPPSSQQQQQQNTHLYYPSSPNPPSQTRPTHSQWS